MVPALVYPTAVAIDAAASAMRSRRAIVMRGAGDSSITFWCRRCTEHSRSTNGTTVPW